VRKCPYPECLVYLDGDADAGLHFASAHRREPAVHNHAPHEIDRLERCKLCPPAGSPFPMTYAANGCKHKDLGLSMIAHVAAFHPDRVIGFDLERDRLVRAVRGRLN
jgi:hypothetical protein